MEQTTENIRYHNRYPAMAETKASNKRASGSPAIAGNLSTRTGISKPTRIAEKSSVKKRSNNHVPSERGRGVEEATNPKRERMPQAGKVIVQPIRSTHHRPTPPAPAVNLRTSKRERTYVNYDMHYHPAGKRRGSNRYY